MDGFESFCLKLLKSLKLQTFFRVWTSLSSSLFQCQSVRTSEKDWGQSPIQLTECTVIEEYFCKQGFEFPSLLFHCVSSPQSQCYVKHIWHVPPAIGLILQLLCSPTGNQNFWQKTKQNITTGGTKHIVFRRLLNVVCRNKVRKYISKIFLEYCKPCGNEWVTLCDEPFGHFNILWESTTLWSYLLDVEARYQRWRYEARSIHQSARY